jgi:hypothetical protein
MPGIKQRRKTWVSTSGDSDYYPSDIEDEPKRYCTKCESFGFPYQQLGERIYQDSELINGQVPRDSESWLQCYRCGTVTAVQHAKQESKIVGFIDVPENIHDTRKLSVEHFINPRKRTSKPKPNLLYQDSTVLVPPEEDKDIQNLTENTSGKELANYSDSTN